MYLYIEYTNLGLGVGLSIEHNEGPNEIRTQYRRNFENRRERESGKPKRELKKISDY